MYVCMYVCMYVYMYVCVYVCMFITYSKDKDQPGMIAKPTRGQLNRKMSFPLSRFVSEYLVSRDMLSPVPRQPAHLYTQTGFGAYLRDSSRVPRWRPFIFLNRHTQSSQSRVYRIMRLRTDGVHCRESAGTGPVNVKVVPNGCCLGKSHHGPIDMRPPFPHPLLV